MPRYRILNECSGVELGTFEAASPEEALEALARARGFSTAEEIRRVLAGAAKGSLVKIEEIQPE